jgi:hypothetical protein
VICDVGKYAAARSGEFQSLEGWIMPGNIFYIIGVVVVVLFILGYLGLR